MRRGNASLSELVARLPRGIDQDLVHHRLPRTGDEQRITTTAFGQLFGVTQQTASFHYAQLKKRLKMIGDHVELRLPAAAERTVVAALKAAGWSPAQARFLWSLYWTTSPKEALRLSPVRNPLRVRKTFLGQAQEEGVLRCLFDGLRCIERLGWGCLWGRQGHRSKFGTKGHRITRAVYVVDIDGKRSRPRRGATALTVSSVRAAPPDVGLTATAESGACDDGDDDGGDAS